MKSRRLAIAFSAACITSCGSTVWLGRHTAPSIVNVRPKYQKVIVAARDMKEGEILSASSVATIDWTSDRPLPSALANPSQVNDRTLLVPVIAGEPIMANHLSVVGSGGSVLAHIPMGSRAFSIKLDEPGLIAGFVQPGCRVDVLFTNRSGADQSYRTNTLLRSVKVLAIEQKIDAQAPEKGFAGEVATLLVNPQQAEDLFSATMQGKLSLTLRNQNDETDKVQFSEVSSVALRSSSKASRSSINRLNFKVETKATEDYVVETVAGDKTSRQVFAKDGRL